MSELPTTLHQWLEYIQQQHSRTIDMTLARSRTVWERMGRPQPAKVITIAGTNGKGSTVALLAAVGQRANIRTGAYTSPHLVRYNERVVIDGQMVEDDVLCDSFARIERLREDIPLTYFEFGTLCALDIFAKQQVQLGLLEVGMGGRLDTVNLLDNDVSIITSIGVDHQAWLGTDPDKIAIEKAGVFRQRSICASAEAPRTLEQVAQQKNTALFRAEEAYEFDVNAANELAFHSQQSELQWLFGEHSPRVPLPIGGAYLPAAVASVIAAYNLLGPDLPCQRESLAAALLSGIADMSLRGRCQVIKLNPALELVVDVAHNEDSLDTLQRFVQSRKPVQHTFAVVGMLEDKPVDQMADAFAKLVDKWFFASLEGDRAQSAEMLQNTVSSQIGDIDSHCDTSPVSAFHHALTVAEDVLKNEAIDPMNLTIRLLIFGSFHTAGDILGDLENDSYK